MNQTSSFIPPWKQETLLRRMWRNVVELRQWFVMALLGVLAWGLWLQVQGRSRFPAHAVQYVHTLGSPVPGMLLRVHVQKGSRVKQGDPLAQIDDKTQRMEWEMAKLEKKRLESLLVTEAMRFRLSQVSLQARLQSFVNEAQTSWVAGRTKMRASRAELSALNKELKWLQQMRTNRLGRTNNLGTLQARQKSLQTLVTEMPRLLRLYRSKRKRARRLYRKIRRYSGKKSKIEMEKILRPLQKQWAIQTLRIKKLTHLKQQMVLRAPVTGVVQEVVQQPGARLLQGAPVVKIVQDNKGTILTYVEESLARRVMVGMQVQAMLRFPKRKHVKSWLNKQVALCATVTGLGVMEPIPMRFRSIPQQPIWVRPVSIRLEKPKALIPGEMMFVEFSSGSCKK